MVISKPPSSPKQKPSSQASGFNLSATITNLQFLQKALFRIGMERIVPNRHSRRNSTGNLTFEQPGYKDILSRYLQPPFPSCHDNCKRPFLNLPLEFNPATSPLENPSSKKLYAPIPRPSTKDVKISKTSLTHQIKPAPIESKSQDFKSKINSKPDPDDPFYLPPSRLTRRYSEVIIPTTGLGDVLDSPAVGGGLTRSNKTIYNKTEPRKNSKPPNSVKTAAKTHENDGKVSRKVQALKAQFSSTVDQGSKKSKPVKPGGDVVQEKKTDKADKIQRRTSSKKDETLQRDGQKNGITAFEVKKTEDRTQIPTSGSSRNEERVSGNGHNGTKISSSKKDETLQQDEQKNGIEASEVKKTENIVQIPTSGSGSGSGSSRNEERVSGNGDNGAQISSSSKKDETLQRDGQKKGITSLEVKKTENIIQSPASGSSRNDERVSGNGQIGSQIFSPSKEDKTLQRDGQKNSITPLEIKKTEKPARVRKLATENGNCSPRKPKFNPGNIIDSESGSSSPRKHKFGQGKVVDENKNSPDNRTSLRRLCSDSVLHSSENRSVDVALKPCKVETNKTHVGLNNVIEETASKLIQTRKSKVKALVGAFEMISKN
ncbi:muscle M-line assembly protein unc-89-like [Cynara cardunculus var. scolymus]|uniref:muscle M-line assembly protein unc-89-like n=1 Tax=Cynara cardunculus var. scolymus TaxID=59895 RepID=UPI000D62DFB7|nr:muscle M-line assembly protein unc-89-like [Cynara cardunculus var. scolymus]